VAYRIAPHERVWRASGAWEDPVSSALRLLSDPDLSPCVSVTRLARAIATTPRSLGRAWSEEMAPWTPKVAVDWVLWLRGAAMVEEAPGRRPALYRVAGALGVREKRLNQAALRRTGVRFLESVSEPVRPKSMVRFEREWREVLAHA